MKIGWLINQGLPELSMLLNQPINPFGGWLVGLSKDLSESGNELHIICPVTKIKRYQIFQGKKIIYHAFSNELSKHDLDELFQSILTQNHFDLVHLHGSEFYHHLSLGKACVKFNISYVVSLQGIISEYAKHYMCALPAEVQTDKTLRDILKDDDLQRQQEKMALRGNDEIELLKMTKHVMGRTTWDFETSKLINPSLNYYHVGETLRPSFYKHTWDIGSIKRHSIFLSQAPYPIKGLHLLLDALNLVKHVFPDVMLYIGGQDIYSIKTLKDLIKQSAYSKYVLSLITKYGLSKHIKFLGILQEEEMLKTYLETHLYVLTSSIENSPNSLGEAMLLGMPIVSSDVGGVRDMLKDQEEGLLYPYDDVKMLASHIIKLFKDDELAKAYGKNASLHARITHHPEKNLKELLLAYKKIMKSKD
jgi:glycosyltransferase involved in cell wall biosynthesis